MTARREKARRAVRSVTFLCAVVSCLACGEPSGPAPEIYGQPDETAVFQGQSARFAVWASGTKELAYQWLRNGRRIPGATSDVYDTPPTEAVDDGSSYSVVVTNDGTSAESAAARLTVYPPLDLRFGWVGAPIQPRVLQGQGQSTTIEYTYFNATGGVMDLPFGCGLRECSFHYTVETAPRGMNVTYAIEGLPPMPRVQWTTPDTVVSGIDLEEGPGLAVTRRLQTDQVGSFTMEQGTVPPADLQDVATAEGLAGRVITGVSFWSGQVAFVSYGWSRDPEGTVYEAKAAFGQFDEVASIAEALSAEGYVLTGVGAGNGGADGFVLVGTRQQGHDAPRPVVATVCAPGSCDLAELQGYRIVASLQNASLRNDESYRRLYVGQK